MIHQKTDTCIRVCMKAWLICESCIHAEVNSVNPRETLIQECTECARSCFAVVSKLVSASEDAGALVLDCLLHCRQCAAECNKYGSENDIALCRDVCAICGDIIKNNMTFSAN